MPYTRSGGLKISDHHVQSPLLNVNHACQTCHRWPEEELKARVDNIQQTTFDMRNRAMDALVELIADIKAAKDAGQTDEQLAAARDFQRRAQFYLDFVEAENSTGFHAPQEATRILGESIDFSRKGQLALRELPGEPRQAIAPLTPAPPGGITPPPLPIGASVALGMLALGAGGLHAVKRRRR
jgi:nitrite reductase (cytochrome c-552)